MDVERWSSLGEMAAVMLSGVVLLTSVWGKNRLLPAQSWSEEGERVTKREGLLLLALVLSAFVLRFAGEHATFWWTLYNQYLLEKKVLPTGFVTSWLQGWWLTHVDYSYQSPLLLPTYFIHNFFHGDPLQAHRFAGSLWGGLTVLAGWALGRAVFSPRIGVLFGFFLAVSPLQIVWGQLGDYYNSALAYLLFSAWFAYTAGLRRNLRLALLSGVVVWGALYLYFLGRAAFLIAPLCLVLGVLRSKSEQGWRSHLCSLLLALLVGVSSCAVLLGGGSFVTDFWPEYAGYVGWRSSGVWDEIHRHWHLYWRELLRTVELYFFQKRLFRIGEAPIDLRWGAESGGLSLGVVSVLGGVGLVLLLVRAFQSRREYFTLSRFGVPLLLVACGLVVTMTSITTARRLLLFDAGWCLLAALGTAWVLDRCRAKKIVSSALFIILPLWSFGVIQYLHHRSSQLLIGGVARVNDIPFGQGWIGDGITCYRCQDVAEEWRETFANNGAVVFFDTDRAREDPASPAGLFLMGKLAAISVDKPDHLFRFYSIVENSSGMPLFQPYYKKGGSYSRYLSERLTALAPSSLLLYSERPSQWEVSLFQRLSLLGVLKRFQTPLSEEEGVSLLLPAERIGEFLAELSALEGAVPATGRITLEEIDGEGLALNEVPWGIALRGEKLAVATSFSVKTRVRDFSELAPITSLNFLPDGALTLQQQYGARYQINASLETATPTDPVKVQHAGFSCFADAGSGGILVDPVRGALRSDLDLSWLPAEPWIGVVVAGEGRVLLASANQRLFVVDLRRRVVERSFSAPVWPSVRLNFAECSMLVAGEKFYGTFHPSTSQLTLFSLAGEPLDTIDLRKRFGFASAFVTAVSADGDRIAIGFRHTLQVRVYRVRGVES